MPAAKKKSTFKVPKFEKSPAFLVELFDALLADRPGDRRQMFGCPCAFTGGQMYAGLFGSQFFVRLSEDDRSRALALDGAKAFDPMGGRPMREYVVLPETLVDDEEALAEWVQKARAFAQSLPPKKAKSGRAQTAPSSKRSTATRATSRK